MKQFRILLSGALFTISVAAALFMSLSCGSSVNDTCDDPLSDDCRLYKTINQETPATDHAPTPGTAVTFSNINPTSVTVTWGASSDDRTPAEKLSYKLVYSTSDNLGSVADAEANGTVALDWTANVLTATVTGLSSATTYYFSVIVKDDREGKSLYEKASQITGTPMFRATAKLPSDVTDINFTSEASTLVITSEKAKFNFQFDTTKYTIAAAASSTCATGTLTSTATGATYETGAVTQDCTVDFTAALKRYTANVPAVMGVIVTPASKTQDYGTQVTFDFSCSTPGCSLVISPLDDCKGVLTEKVGILAYYRGYLYTIDSLKKNCSPLVILGT
jgi:hypothetical protein